MGQQRLVGGTNGALSLTVRGVQWSLLPSFSASLHAIRSLHWSCSALAEARALHCPLRDPIAARSTRLR